jgi:prophage DNA circulation protein
MQLLLDTAIEAKGPGLLIHPTIGALQVGLLSAGTAMHWDKLRVIEVEFEFLEVGAAIFPLTVIATIRHRHHPSSPPTSRCWRRSTAR